MSVQHEARVAPEEAVFRPALPSCPLPGMTEMQMTYSEKLKHPKWQKRRLEILNRDAFTCRHCGDTEKTLHVHHLNYVKGGEPWDAPDGALLTLCADCHAVAGDEERDAASTLVSALKDHGADASAMYALSLAIDLNLPRHSAQLKATEWHAVAIFIGGILEDRANGADIVDLANKFCAVRASRQESAADA